PRSDRAHEAGSAEARRDDGVQRALRNLLAVRERRRTAGLVLGRVHRLWHRADSLRRGGMSYENPQIPEGINVGRDNALLEFLRLVAGFAVVALAIAAVLYFAGGALARLIPFETERGWVGTRNAPGIAPVATGREDIESYLQELGDRLAAEMDL